MGVPRTFLGFKLIPLPLKLIIIRLFRVKNFNCPDPDLGLMPEP
jgi:hypothetical protein